MDNWLPVRDAALRLGITPQAVRNRMKAGKLEHRKNNQKQTVVQVPNGMDVQGSEVGRLANEVAKARDEGLRALAEAEERHRQAIQDQENRHRTALEGLEKRHGAELARLENAHRQALEVLERALARSQEGLVTRFRRWIAVKD